MKYLICVLLLCVACSKEELPTQPPPQPNTGTTKTFRFGSGCSEVRNQGNDTQDDRCNQSFANAYCISVGYQRVYDEDGSGGYICTSELCTYSGLGTVNILRLYSITCWRP